MKNWQKIVLLLIVLMPSFFFLSKAFMANRVGVNEGVLEVKGAGALELPIAEIDSLDWQESLPELAGTGGYALGLVKKGNFLRKSDQKQVRIMRNGDEGFIHLFTQRGEVYLNLSSAEDTKKLYQELLAAEISD